MSGIFIKIVNMSISASWLMLVILLLRVLLKKVPKWISVLLWCIAGIRLVLPFSVESAMSLLPRAQTIKPNMSVSVPEINPGIAAVDNIANPVIGDAVRVIGVEKEADVLKQAVLIFSKAWLVGIAVLLVYALVSFLLLRKKVSTAVRLKDNVYQSEAVISPFVLGIIKPKIYLPFNISENNTEYVVLHESAHIKRGDNIIKPLGFLILSLHWFNPLVWLGYILLCRDIELACDERVIKELNKDCRAEYSQALLNCSVRRTSIAACPLAFGEVGVKQRIKSVLNYKKPAFWLVAVALLLCAVAAVCFLTDPKEKPKDNTATAETGADISLLGVGSEKEDVSIEVTSLKAENSVLVLSLRWHNNSPYTISFGEPFKLLREVDGQWLELEMLKNTAWHLPSYTVFQGKSAEKENGYRLTDAFDLSEGGKYRFVTDFSYDCDGTKKFNVWVDFSIPEAEQPEMPKNIYGYYSEYDRASLSLYPEANEFLFVYSDLASFFATGKYIEENGKIVCKDNNGKNVYTFAKKDDNVIFLASESSEMPKYKYKANGEATVCVPDKAVFVAVSSIAESNFNPVIDSLVFDIDGDGVEENCSLRFGPTSGLFTFSFNASVDGKPKYYNMFHSLALDFGFVDIDGKTKLKGTGFGDSPQEFVYDITVNNGDIELICQGEKMAYWGEQGITSRYLIQPA